MLFALILGFIAGAILVVILDVIAIWYWLRLKPQEEPKLVPKPVKVKNPKDVADYCKSEGATPSESCMFLNLMIAFLWREWRDTAAMKSYFIKKMNLEFQELLLNKAAGKMLNQICVKDYCLGDSLPVIKEATVMKVQSREPDQVAQELDLALEIEYSGGFLISLDVDLIFGKTAYLAVKVNSLKGRLRLQFTRIPCTHWSFSFYEDPEMDIEVASQFNGKNLARLTNLIKNLIRKSVKRKHTLPRYKVRYKPFFRQPAVYDGKQEVFVHNSLVTVGKLEVEVMDCSRLPSLPLNSLLYCTISIDSLPWKEGLPINSSLWPVHEVTLTRTLTGSVGVSIKQTVRGQDEYQKELVVVDTITPQSPASSSDIRRGDVLLAVNDIDIESLKQAIRLIKNGGDKLVFKLQRPPTVPSVRVETQETSDVENDKDDSNSIKINDALQRPELENSFNFDNVMLDDDDSDGEEFVNIVVQELEQQIGKDDEKAKKILRKVSLSARRGKTPRANSVNFKLDEGEVDVVDSAEKKNGCHDELADAEGRKISSSSSDQTVPNCAKESLKIPNRNAIATDHHQSLRPKSTRQKEGNTDEKKGELARESNSENERHRKKVKQNSLRRRILHRRDRSIEIDSDSSDSQSLQSFETDGDGGWDNISQHTLLSKEEEPRSIQRTSTISSNVDPAWNENFSFDIEKQHKFLNICVWSKCDERYSKDVLIGYASISLMEISLECLSTSSRKHTQSYNLTQPYSRAGVSRTSLRVLMPGLKPEACNGDIALCFCYKPNLASCSLPKDDAQNTGYSNVSGKEEIQQTDQASTANGGLLDTKQMHDFMSTQFYFPTRCDYCQKKVWTKAAFQCRVCAMISHKKCINNAHSNTYCTRMGVRAKPPAWHSEEDGAKKQNGVTFKETTESRELVDDQKQDLAQGKERQEDPTQISRTDATVDEPRQSLQLRTKSSPTLLRKKNSSSEQSEGADHPLQRSFSNSHSSIDSIAHATITAEQAGKELFSTLEDENRKGKLEHMVQKLEIEINDENEKQMDLSTALEKVTDSGRRSKLQMALRKSQDRKQALSLLMVQYHAALQECLGSNEAEDCLAN